MGKTYTYKQMNIEERTLTQAQLSIGFKSVITQHNARHNAEKEAGKLAALFAEAVA